MYYYDPRTKKVMCQTSVLTMYDPVDEADANEFIALAGTPQFLDHYQAASWLDDAWYEKRPVEAKSYGAW